MKVWAKVHIKDKNKDVELISKSFTNYLYGYGPVNELCRKYNITSADRKMLDQYTANRIAGLLMLYLSKDVKRINDIANKYNVDVSTLPEILPEIERYIEKKYND